jgi:hypothetical protein
VLSAHLPLQTWKPCAQVKPQRWFELHDGVPFATAGQSASTQQLAEAMHVAPQRLKPVMHEMPHF